MRDPQALMSTEQLSSILGQSSVRIYDCTTYLETPPPGSDDPYVAVPGRRTFEEAHVPGADFLDLQGEFSDSTTRLRFMMPATGQLEAAFGRHGLGGERRIRHEAALEMARPHAKRSIVDFDAHPWLLKSPTAL